jgi:hypothetical protein
MSMRLSRRSRKAGDWRGDATTPLRRSRLSYANVTASLALFVALGGTSYAAIKLPARSVGTIQLKSRAVTNAKIAPNAVDGSKVRDGSLTGLDIAGKVAAAITADRLAYVRHITVVATNDPAPAGSFSTKGGVAACPPGTFVVGGGVSLGDRSVQLVSGSYPSSTTAWTAEVDNVAPATPSFTVYAVCAPAAAAG